MCQKKRIPASLDEIQRARTMYASHTDDIEIDDDALVSRPGPEEGGVWVSAWVWVRHPDATDDEMIESSSETDAGQEDPRLAETCSQPLTRMIDNRAPADRVMAVFDVPPYDEDDLSGSLKDLLTDCLHLADREGIDFEEVLGVARRNHEAETAEDDGDEPPIDPADVDDPGEDPNNYLGYCLVCGHPVLNCAGSETRCGQGVAHDEDCLAKHARACEDCRAEDEGDDLCDNCQSSGVTCEQTCPGCGKTLCGDCAESNDGYCSDCDPDDEDTDTALEDVDPTDVFKQFRDWFASIAHAKVALGETVEIVVTGKIDQDDRADWSAVVTYQGQELGRFDLGNHVLEEAMNCQSELVNELRSLGYNVPDQDVVQIVPDESADGRTAAF